MRRMASFAPWAAVGAGLAALAAAYLFVRSGWDFGYAIPRRLVRLAAMVLGGICIAWSSIVFQTVTGNRILTPAVMGYEAVYLLLQSLLVLALGSEALAVLGATGHFFASVALMLAYAGLLHGRLLRGSGGDVYSMLLLGLVLTLVMGTFTQFVQFGTSPGEFSMLLGFTQASFNRAQPAQLLLAGVAVAAVCWVGVQHLRVLDVLTLGRDQATSLGVDHRRAVRLQLVLVATLVAVSTSLLGPTAFMGIFVANMAYALARSTRHRATLPMGCAIAVGIFIAAQLAVEHVFNYRTTVGILVNLVCGAYFLARVVRSRGIA
jgi:iron complex transport system permease protein